MIKIKLLLFLLFISFALLFFIKSTNQLKPPVMVLQIQEDENVVFPVRLIIPSINVNASLQQLGITLTGDMDVPNNITDAGWYKLGPRPGQRGSAVIAGHLNGIGGERAVFADLYRLKENDEISVEDDDGKYTVFAVREIREYNPGQADEVFTKSDGKYLNLITCDGLWDFSKNSYGKRLVIFAKILE